MPIMRDFEIWELEDLSGDKAKIYSVILDGDDKTLLEHFIDENQIYRKDLKKVLNIIKNMANETGCKKEFFKEYEGKLGDGVVALNYTGLLRLYGIYFNNSVILFGSGGLKPPEVISWQQSPDLRPKVEKLEKIAAEIYKMITNKELKIMPDGSLLEQ